MIRMYKMDGVEEIALFYNNELHNFVVATDKESKTLSDPREAWVLYTQLLANHVLGRINKREEIV